MAERGGAAFYKSTFQIIGAFFCYFICRGAHSSASRANWLRHIEMGRSASGYRNVVGHCQLSREQQAEIVGRYPALMDKCRFVEFDRASNRVDPISNWPMLMGADSVAALAKIDDMK